MSIRRTWVRATRFGLLLVGVVMISACGIVDDTGPVSPPVSTTPQPGGPTSSDLVVIVPPGLDGRLPPELIVSCPNGPAFPVSALEGVVALDEGDPGGMADAIAPFLEGPEGVYWPQTGWIILYQTESTAILAHDGPEGVSFMELSKSGAWEWSGADGGGPCPLQYRVPAGLNTVEWRLDPAAASPEPEDDTVAVILNERECVSGEEIGDRLRGPQIVMTDSQVFIAFASTPPAGDAFYCQGNPDTPFLVELPELLGDRELVEGSATGLRLEDYLG